ncbi:methyltransferase type 11 [Dulcicalothrix desertica PCC 7102]|uniref:Methyltransferase type 11 n=1 Tax=Dulcicalothrix desertica PCC 7102 TaxID=232991 RepID=A0A433VFD6_9CYAN|nr:class I SAM-dependent methyltransferase [Dulcicalothrix desertica]RUT04783.1 methyltransferase type 11 [Dulcicalothrix desertica PCC 7102]TWH42794.1 Methylase involved in ubiquinone/menaquinone biosynthesis [Dulcicalothrix desertica PCC 7102]
MTAAIKNTPDIASRLVNGVLAIKPLANFAKHQARQMMIKRAHELGVPWKNEVDTLKTRDWQSDLAQVKNPDLSYPEYYLTSFHAYESGNMSWLAAFEVESAAYAVHAKIWQDAGAQGDTKLRQNYHNILIKHIPNPPQTILDIGCSVGMSTFALQYLYSNAQVTGLDLSPYFLAVAHYRAQERQAKINWVHAAAESTGLPNASFDLVSIFLVCHELPQTATKQIFAEARRLLRPNGHLAIMDMNPRAEAFKMMPPYVFTLLKSTEPYLDDYFSLDIEQALIEAGFTAPVIASNSPRHRTIIAKVA